MTRALSTKRVIPLRTIWNIVRRSSYRKRRTCLVARPTLARNVSRFQLTTVALDFTSFTMIRRHISDSSGFNRVSFNWQNMLHGNFPGPEEVKVVANFYINWNNSILSNVWSMTRYTFKSIKNSWKNRRGHASCNWLVPHFRTVTHSLIRYSLWNLLDNDPEESIELKSVRQGKPLRSIGWHALVDRPTNYLRILDNYDWRKSYWRYNDVKIARCSRSRSHDEIIG